MAESMQTDKVLQSRRLGLNTQIQEEGEGVVVFSGAVKDRMEGLTELCVSRVAAVSPIFMHERVQRHVWTQFSWGSPEYVCALVSWGSTDLCGCHPNTLSVGAPQNNPRLCF